MKSQARAISQPPPRAKPLTAAITGMGRACRLLITSWPNWANCLAPSGDRVAISVMSAPAMKDFSPAPVRIRTRTVSSAPTWWTASASSVRRAELRALRALGRLKVSVAIPSALVRSMQE